MSSTNLLSELNSKFGIPGSVDFVAGNNDMTRVDLKLGEASAQVYLHGATVTSFNETHSNRIIWLSDSAVFAPGKAIRGGIPICWPQFGPGALVQHGFARTSLFNVVASAQSATQASVTMRLESNEQTKALWPYDFQLDVMVELCAILPGRVALKIELGVYNLSATDFTFTGALHSYFDVPHVNDIAVRPFHQHSFFDKVTSSQRIQEEDLVTIHGETDRVYHEAPSVVMITNEKDKSQPMTVIKNSQFSDVVLWNPGAEKQKSMADLSGWENFVCVEVAVVKNPVLVASGQSWHASQEIYRYIPSLF
jgi:glucose-6-phosphate 1-epimerase